MGSTTTTFTLTVAAAGQTVLEKIVAALPAGEWSNESLGYELANNHPDRPADATKINESIGPVFGSGALAYPPGLRAWLGYNTPTSSGYAILPGAGGPYSSHYDPTLKQWWHVSGTTGSAPYAQTIVRYSVERDEFEHWQGSAGGASDGPWNPYGYPHNFGGSALSVSRRRLYRLLQPETQTSPDPNNLRPNGGKGLFYADIDSVPSDGANLTRGYLGIAGPLSDAGSYPPMEYFPELDSIILLLSLGLPKLPWRYDCVSNAWVQDIPTSLTFGGLATMVYCNGAMYAAGSGIQPAGPKYPSLNFYRINADKSVDQLANTPVYMNSSGWYQDNYPTTPYSMHTEMVALGTNIYAFHVGDPTLNGAIYKYDTLTNVWSGPIGELPLPRPEGSLSNVLGFTVAAVPEHNCVLWARYINPTTDQALVWKPPG